MTPFIEKNRPRALESQKEAKFAKILITGNATSTSQCCGIDLLTKLLCTVGAAVHKVGTAAPAPCLHFLAFTFLALFHLIFTAITISRPNTYKTTKLAKNMHEKPKISIGN